MAKEETAKPEDIKDSTLKSQRPNESGLTPDIAAYTRVYRNLIIGGALNHDIPLKEAARRFFWASVDVTNSFDSTPQPQGTEPNKDNLIHVHQTPTWYTPTQPFALINPVCLNQDDIIQSTPQTQDREITPTIVDPAFYTLLINQTLPNRPKKPSPPKKDDRILLDGAMPVYVDSNHELAGTHPDTKNPNNTETPDEYVVTFTITPTPPPSTQPDNDDELTLGTAIRTYGE